PAHLRLGGELPVRQARADGDSGAAAGPVALRGSVGAPRHPAAPHAPAGATAAAARFLETDLPARARRRSGEPGPVPLWVAAFDRRPCRPHLHADAALRAAAR